MDRTTDTRAEDRRKEPRHAVRCEAVLYCEAIREPVVVTNISQHGAMLIGRSFPPPRAYVTLAIAGHDLAATVTWSRDEKCGLMFHERIDPATFVDALAESEKEAGLPDHTSQT